MKPKLITVDKHNLEQEWTDQPGAVHWVNIQWAEALKTRKEADANVEMVMAAVGVEAREILGEKATETAVKRAVLASKAYQQAVALRDQAAHEQHLIEAERTALDHKKAALENLTKLRLSDWYSEPKHPGGTSKNKDGDEQRAELSKTKPRKRPGKV